MILTGKAREAFLDWVESHGWVDSITVSPSNELLAINKQQLRSREIESFIIEWLDSVGCFISIEHDSSVFNDRTDCFRYFIWFSYEYCDGHEYYYETRQQATEAAIKKANEIYNGR